LQEVCSNIKKLHPAPWTTPEARFSLHVPGGRLLSGEPPCRDLNRAIRTRLAPASRSFSPRSFSRRCAASHTAQAPLN
jgi:hypothetical protein